MQSARPPLDGLRVVEVGNFMAVPFCGMQLADLGADVVKVENPRGGDLTRQTGPFIDGESSNFVRLNRNKRSLALDLKSPDGKAVFRRLVERADVVIENLRPGTMRGLGLDYTTLHASVPGLIYCSVSGFGADGPYAERPGLDIIAQGMSGLMSITGESGGAPAKVGVPIADLTCALYATIAVLAALRARERDGRGQHIDVSLLESAVSLAIWEAGRWFATGEVPQATGSAHQSIAPYQAVRAVDGWFTFGANTQDHWLRACDALGLAALSADERYATNERRLANRDDLHPPGRGVDRGADGGRRPVRPDLELRPRLHRSASRRSGLLLRCAAPDARVGPPARLSAAPERDATADGTCRPVARR
jgi:formyl-CoA transferase